MKCTNCKKSEWNECVQFQSYFLQSKTCNLNGSATTFRSYAKNMRGNYRVYEIPKNDSNRTLILHGRIEDMLSLIQSEAEKGKLIQMVKQ